VAGAHRPPFLPSLSLASQPCATPPLHPPTPEGDAMRREPRSHPPRLSLLPSLSLSLPSSLLLFSLPSTTLLSLPLYWPQWYAYPPRKIVIPGYPSHPRPSHTAQPPTRLPMHHAPLLTTGRATYNYATRMPGAGDCGARQKDLSPTTWVSNPQLLGNARQKDREKKGKIETQYGANNTYIGVLLRCAQYWQRQCCCRMVLVGLSVCQFVWALVN